jgi:hypothetical protein
MAVTVPKTVLAIRSSMPKTRCPALREMRVRSDWASVIVGRSVTHPSRRSIVLSG